MKLFTFDPRAFAAAFLENGYIHVEHGVSDEFLDFAQKQLAHCRRTGCNELPGREIKSKKKQYLFALPDHELVLYDLMRTIGIVTDTAETELTLSERHLMVYDNYASPLPPLHKDRAASRFSVGIPLSGCSDDRIALLPQGPRGTNVLDSAVYCSRTSDSVARSAEGWNLNDGDYPEAATDTEPILIEVSAKPGDVVIFAGSTIYHGRLNAAGSSVLYFKLSNLNLDPLGEDPRTPVQRVNTLSVLKSESDEQLLDNMVELSPRLLHISRLYSRLHWTPILRASGGGEKEFTISDGDWSFIYALRGRRRVRDVLLSANHECDRLLDLVPAVRRLAKLGAIDLLV